MFLTDETRLEMDYLSPTASVLIAPKDIEVNLRNTVRITDDDNSLIYVGFVSNIERKETLTRISVKPLIALLDEISRINTATTFASQIYNQMRSDFFYEGNVALYRIPWVYTSPYVVSNWEDELSIVTDAPLMTDLSLVQTARRQNNRWMFFNVGMGRSNLGKPLFGFRARTEPVTVEADLESIISKEIEESAKGGYNIAMIWSDSGYYFFCYKDDGTFSNDLNDKYSIANPRITAKIINNTPTTEELVNMRKQMISPNSTNFSITLKVKKDYELFRFDDYDIGQIVDVIYNGKTYRTNLTGWAIEGDVVEYRFGTLRDSLTDILIREKG